MNNKKAPIPKGKGALVIRQGYYTAIDLRHVTVGYGRRSVRCVGRYGLGGVWRCRGLRLLDVESLVGLDYEMVLALYVVLPSGGRG